MIKWILVSSLLITQTALAGNSLAEIAQRCSPPGGNEAPLYSSEFHWGFSLPEMLEKFSEVYLSNKRLPKRAYWDASRQALILPYDEFRGGDIQISERFVQAVVQHIERAFAEHYVDAVFFPDMGHSHLLIPHDSMKEKYNKYPVSEMSRMYEDLFADPQIKILYHTAEQLQALDENDEVLNDPKIRWRHHTRNIVGENSPSSDLVYLQNPESRANTVNDVPGYRWWGAGFNLSAQKSGCFEYKVNGQGYYFDLSMYDLTSDPDDMISYDHR